MGNPTAQVDLSYLKSKAQGRAHTFDGLYCPKSQVMEYILLNTIWKSCGESHCAIKYYLDSPQVKIKVARCYSMSRTGAVLGHALLRSTHRKSYVGNPTTPFDLTLSDLEVLNARSSPLSDSSCYGKVS